MPHCAPLAAVACTGVQQSRGDVAVYLDESQPLEKRVEDALSRMTLEEKVGLLHAQSKFSSAGVPRLGIPKCGAPTARTASARGLVGRVGSGRLDERLVYGIPRADVPRRDVEPRKCRPSTANPSARRRVTGIRDVLLGPGVNIYRTPLNGRNFEYMGEDPFLSARMVSALRAGGTAERVAACVKHFAVNNQELRRHEVDVVVDDRALHEIYLPAFKAAVQEGGAWAIMGAYQ